MRTVLIILTVCCVSVVSNAQTSPSHETNILRPLSGLADSILVTSLDTTPIITQLGSRVYLRYRLQYSGTRYCFVELSTIENIDPSLQRDTFVHYRSTMSAALPDTAVLSFVPTCPGIYNLQVEFVFFAGPSIANVWQWHQVVVPGDSGSIIAKPATIVFAPQSMCTADFVFDTITVFPTGCRSQLVDSIRIIGDSSRPSFSVFRGSSGFTVNAKDSTTFTIDFRPVRSGVERASLILYHGGGNDTISLQGAGIRDAYSMQIASDTLTPASHDSSNVTLRIAAQTCGTIGIDSIVLPFGAVLPPGKYGHPQLPLELDSGISWPLIVRFPAMTTSSTSIPVRIFSHFVDGAETVTLDTTISIPLRPNLEVRSALINNVLELYPDPANEVLNVQLSYPATYEVLDIAGNVVSQGHSANQTIAIQTASVPAGSYILRLTASGGIVSRRFVVQH